MAYEHTSFIEEDSTYETVYNITDLIKYKHDFNAAIQLIRQNNISLEDIATKTVRLSPINFIKLADMLIDNKGI